MKPEPHIQSHCKAPYLVATPRGYTKHYYAESERIDSKIGGGIFSYGERRISKFVAYKKLGMCKRLNSDCSKRPKGASLSCLACRFQFLATICVAAKRLSFGSFLWQDKEKEQRILHDSLAPEKALFFYHPDHLGSSSWITYSDGKSIQHLHYLPMLKSCAFFPPWHSAEQTSWLCAHCLRRFGETFINHKTTTFAARYTFSGKEKDTETGYNYFGARYYSSDLSIWLSVDPMSDKYPSLSPYVYCADNPVMLVDPDGRKIIIHGKNGTNTNYTPGMKCHSSDAFTRRSIRALNKLSNGHSPTASSMIEELATSQNTFFIEYCMDNSHFSYDSRTAFAIPNILSTENNAYCPNIGAGGTIYWNGKGSRQMTSNGFRRSAIMDLAHELVHGLDANRGLFSFDRLTYNDQTMPLCEWNACYQSNVIRKELGNPYQIRYGGHYSFDGLNYIYSGGGVDVVKKGILLLPQYIITQ